MTVTVIDWIFLGLILISLLLGLWRGLIYEVFALIGWFAAFFIAQYFAPDLAPELPLYLPLAEWGEPVHYALAFVLIFILVLIGSNLLAWGLRQISMSIGLKPLDRFLGGAFGLARGALLLLVLTAGVLMTPFAQDARWTDSLSQSYLIAGLVALKPVLPAKIQGYIELEPH